MTLRFLTSGESHGPALVAILEGLPAGIPISSEAINAELTRRQQGYGSGPRMKIERDTARILGGVMAGLSTGAPVAIVIENRDHEKWHGRSVPPFTIPRPGHADLTSALKYRYRDLRIGLERASARETAARVAVGAVCKIFLLQFGVRVGGYVTAIGEVEANLETIPHEERFLKAEQSDVRCPDFQAAQLMRAKIQETMQARDTLGGVIEVVALGLPPGLGSHVHWDRRLESRIGAAVLSVQAIKGVEIGLAFEIAHKLGTQSQDGIELQGEDLLRTSLNSGGLEGGITTGQPLIVRAAMKPISTTLTPQQTVDLTKGVQVATQYERSDFCPVPRAVVVVESMLAFVLADALLEKLGGDSLQEIHPRFERLARAHLSDLEMDDHEHVFWPD
ncbi:MAG: chorismate synthase [Anaerolineales bacterium]